MQPGVGDHQVQKRPGTPVGDLFPLGNALLGDGNRGSLRPIRAGELRSHSAFRNSMPLCSLWECACTTNLHEMCLPFVSNTPPIGMACLCSCRVTGKVTTRKPRPSPPSIRVHHSSNTRTHKAKGSHELNQDFEVNHAIDFTQKFSKTLVTQAAALEFVRKK